MECRSLISKFINFFYGSEIQGAVSDYVAKKSTKYGDEKSNNDIRSDVLKVFKEKHSWLQFFLGRPQNGNNKSLLDTCGEEVINKAVDNFYESARKKFKPIIEQKLVENYYKNHNESLRPHEEIADEKVRNIGRDDLNKYKKFFSLEEIRNIAFDKIRAKEKEKKETPENISKEEFLWLSQSLVTEKFEEGLFNAIRWGLTNDQIIKEKTETYPYLIKSITKDRMNKIINDCRIEIEVENKKIKEMEIEDKILAFDEDLNEFENKLVKLGEDLEALILSEQSDEEEIVVSEDNKTFNEILKQVDTKSKGTNRNVQQSFLNALASPQEELDEYEQGKAKYDEISEKITKLKKDIADIDSKIIQEGILSSDLPQLERGKKELREDISSLLSKLEPYKKYNLNI